jgi:hypothetical protein
MSTVLTSFPKTGMAAAGTNQATATILTNNTHHEFTTVGASTGALLPVGLLPSEISVYNDGSNTLAIYPPVGGSIDGGTTNASVSLAAGSGVTFWASTPSNWYYLSSPSSSSGSVTQIIAGAGLTGGTITSTGTIALATTGLELDQTLSAITADVDGATITFNCGLTNWHAVTLGGNRTLALSNVGAGQQFTLVLTQDATGSRTVTWFSTIRWAGGSAPTLSSAANKADIFTFKQISANTYYGMVVGQNF